MQIYFVQQPISNNLLKTNLSTKAADEEDCEKSFANKSLAYFLAKIEVLSKYASVVQTLKERRYLCPEVEFALGNFAFPCLHSIMSGNGLAGNRST